VVEEVTQVPAPSDAAEPEGRTVLAPSFVEFYEQRYASMVRLAVALMGSSTSAEDLVQDSFVRVHARWDRISNPPAYLRRAVVNACRSAHRRTKHERTVATLEPRQPSTLDADELFDMLAQLPYRQRAALVLQFYAGLSRHEIAEVLECREGTVGSLVHRGLAQLQKMMVP
jgi:RNA polymerase sigma-70 factor (sigma-E family)